MNFDNPSDTFIYILIGLYLFFNYGIFIIIALFMKGDCSSGRRRHSVRGHLRNTKYGVTYVSDHERGEL